MMKLTLALLLCALILLTPVLAEEAAEIEVESAGASYFHEPNPDDPADLPEGVSPLPIDFSPGMEPQKDGFIKKSDYAYEYKDPSLHITIETGRVDKCDYWIATIKLADASQLRTESAGGFNSTATVQGQAMAKRTNAVLAINGDYFCYSGNGGNGYIVRQGEVYNDSLAGNRDVLAIDAKGDFHLFYTPNSSKEVKPDDENVPFVNVFYFGPILVDNGKTVKNVTGKAMAVDEKRQRMALCQVGPLEYKAICCAAPARGSAGMTLQQFADFVGKQGVQTAYNLDGGDSTMMMFNTKKINDVRSTSTRKINDIIYFASAYTAREAAE